MTRWRRRITAAGLALLCAVLPPVVAAKQPVRSLVTTVYASSEMAPDCTRAAMIAVDHLNAIGAELDLVFVDLDHRVFLVQNAGEVAVRADVLPNDPKALVETHATTRDGIVVSAEVVGGWCHAAAMTHDLAHVVGLERAVDLDAVWHAE